MSTVLKTSSRRLCWALREKVAWCRKRQLCLNPRLVVSYVILFIFLYVTYALLWFDNSISHVGKHEHHRTLPPDKSQLSRSDPQRDLKKNVRQLVPLKIPRFYSKPVASFVPLLTRFDGQERTLSQPSSVLRNETLLKSAAGVERKRKPTPQSPPQFKESSPYKVFKNYLGPPVKSRTSANFNSSVTYATHATFNYLKNLVDLSRRWNGPLSVSVYAPGDDFALAVEMIVYLRACFPSVRNSASFHLIYDADLSPDTFPHHLNWVNATADCNNYERHSVVRANSSLFLTYPINVARNVARACSKTKYVLVSDVEQMPSADLARKFGVFIERETKKSSLQHHTVFVLPVFEIAPGREIPRTKKDLIGMVVSRTAFYFHSLICPHCQRFPGISQWISSEKPSDSIKVFTVTKREGIYQRWEPLYIGTKKDPFFDERLTWDGLQDKMSQALEMCLIGYRFLVLDSAFLVHRPGLRTVSYSSNDSSVKWRRPFLAYNKNATSIIQDELRMKYPGAFKRGMCLSM